MTSNSKPADRQNGKDEKGAPLASYFTFDALCFGILWGYLAFLTLLLQILAGLAKPLQRSRVRATSALTRYWYRNVTKVLDDQELTFLNYGYASLEDSDVEPDLSKLDEPHRLSIQLYHHVVSAIDVSGLDLLEVSCGHGGGASYVMRYLRPQSINAVDLNPSAVAWCQRRIRVEGLRFSEGDAQSLPFDTSCCDAVINVEASHCYPDMKAFLSEVVRVLRPGGHLLFADLRKGQRARELLHEELVKSGLELTRKEDITANILKALELDSDRRLKLITRLVPKIVRRYFMDWAAIEGSRVYESLRAGESAYLSYVLRKAIPSDS